MMVLERGPVVSMLHPQPLGERVSVSGRLTPTEKPGFGVELNRTLSPRRPYHGGVRFAHDAERPRVHAP